MEQIICETEVDDIREAFKPLIDKANMLGYNVRVSSDMSVLIVRSDTTSDMMPDIKVRTELDGDTYYFIPEVKFPVVSISDGEYLNKVETWTNAWVKVGKFCTELASFGYTPEDREE